MACHMTFAHLTLPTRHVAATASFLEQTLGCGRVAPPPNSPVDTIWLDLGRGQQLHVVYVEGFEVSGFEGEFGRHVAVFVPPAQFGALKLRLADRGAPAEEPIRRSAVERFFFREPVNGYVFEVIAEAAGA
jgi:catechol 2,3-dioxygenase-like lactoylglutathione lyase family enzyme